MTNGLHSSEVGRHLVKRLSRAPSESSVAGSLPVLFFGDILAANAATVGLNPSKLEYLDRHGQELTGSQRRFETLSSLGASTRTSLTPEQARRAIDRMRTYFHGNVYTGWFSRTWRVLQGAGHDYKHDAVHLDLVQEATDPTWSNLEGRNPEEYETLRAKDFPFLRWLLEAFPITRVLADGKTALRGVAELTGADLEQLGTLGKLKIYAGIGSLAGRIIEVGGWNLPLMRAGLTKEKEHQLGQMIADALEHRT